MPSYIIGHNVGNLALCAQDCRMNAARCPVKFRTGLQIFRYFDDAFAVNHENILQGIAGGEVRCARIDHALAASRRIETLFQQFRIGVIFQLHVGAPHSLVTLVGFDILQRAYKSRGEEKSHRQFLEI